MDKVVKYLFLEQINEKQFYEIIKNVLYFSACFLIGFEFKGNIFNVGTEKWIMKEREMLILASFLYI